MLSAFDAVRTSRLALRRPTGDDLGAVIEIHSDPLTNQFNPGGPTAATACVDLLAAWREHWRAYSFGYWAAEKLHEPARVIGFGGVRRLEDDPAIANLYFRFAPSAWGNGFARELAATAIKLAFDHLPIDRVVGSVRKNNEPSRRVLERLCMTLRREIADDRGYQPSLVYEIDADRSGS